jgi:hypothetical protein
MRASIHTCFCKPRLVSLGDESCATPLRTPAPCSRSCADTCRAEELVAPYYVFKNAGFDVTVASIKGGQIPIDEASLQGENPQ